MKYVYIPLCMLVYTGIIVGADNIAYLDHSKKLITFHPDSITDHPYLNYPMPFIYNNEIRSKLLEYVDEKKSYRNRLIGGLTMASFFGYCIVKRCTDAECPSSFSHEGGFVLGELTILSLLCSWYRDFIHTTSHIDTYNQYFMISKIRHIIQNINIELQDPSLDNSNRCVLQKEKEYFEKAQWHSLGKYINKLFN